MMNRFSQEGQQVTKDQQFREVYQRLESLADEIDPDRLRQDRIAAGLDEALAAVYRAYMAYSLGNPVWERA